METIKEFCSQETIDLTELLDKFPDSSEYIDDLSFQQTQRFVNIPICFKLNKIAEINQTHKIVLIKGTVIRAGIAKSMSKILSYRCKECKFVTEVQSCSSNYFMTENQLKCQNIVIKQQKYNPFFKQKFQGFKKQKCNSTAFEKLEDSKLIDYQEIKIQDTYTTIEPGTISNNIRVMLEGEFVNSCNSGDDVIIGGIVTQRWKMIKQIPQITLWIDCKYLRLQNQLKLLQNIDNDQLNCTFQHRNQVINSFIPELCNQWQVKLGTLLSLIGGVTKSNNGITVRGDSHLLLIGEPGTGKSTFLRNACTISEKSIYVNGIGTTQAGLTLSFVKEGSDWMIEAGALVMADQGLCCIDEFNLLNQQSQQSILEALEQQTISSSKAGISTKLNARTTIIAACNPVEQVYNSKLSIQYNSGLSTPLLSRFDQIYILKDQHDYELDKQLCDHIFNLNNNKQNYTLKQLKQYIIYVKNTFQPIMNEDCQQVIQKYFTFIRQSTQQVTARKLESLIRLSEAHARLCSKRFIDEFDVVTVIALIESTQFTGIYPEFQECLTETVTIDKIQEMWNHLKNI
ncbi:unnamed protein product [Paramecium pentaurelia]|uniref:MCM C-terminal AAA(+) ATPase domain-containing protein n=1 Tax=Paramecium pentaurelia TaxID=43138 RepID=A0A8S1W872_9CILI|nr:unnamed protein product [Paramecium pentaurelia]